MDGAAFAAARITEADDALAWAGGSLALIRERWADTGPQGPVLDLTGEDRIPAVMVGPVLEHLRVARSDVQHLLNLIDLLALPAGEWPTRSTAPRWATKWDQQMRPLW